MQNKDVFHKLVDTYNNIGEESIGKLAFEDNFFKDKKVEDDDPDDFDTLTPKVFSHAMEYLNFHYQVAWRNNKKSGSHNDFHKFVGNHPYLYYYHLWIYGILPSPSFQMQS